MPPLMNDALRRRFASDLLESDARYFEAGAISVPVPGGRLLHVPGLTALGGGCVLHRVEPLGPFHDPEALLRRWERGMAAALAEHARIYLTVHDPFLEATLRRHGYRPSVEAGMVLVAQIEADTAGKVELREIKDDADWRVKLALHHACGEYPDSLPAASESFVALERLKVERGYMKAYLICHEGHVCGTVGAAPVGSILRMKNLVVHQHWRRRGIARQTARLFGQLARAANKLGAGLFAIASEHKEAIYREVGYQTVVHQVEWHRPLTASARARTPSLCA